ncbi:MAG: excinuclease ABC subunit UvrA, partial [Coriobacteriales bacterium]|nr:excinuclease ABC subunit UvrA [Coriobacteriales bacterium]
MDQDSIRIRGAREHNLKNLDVDIPRDKLVVITGLSGSGKSSLAFDTLFAEGQRRYVESLSSYARQFLGQMGKPDLDSVDGLSPAVSIDQKSTNKNPRSTVGTVTEIYDYLRLLYARVGIPHCPECGREIMKQTTDQVADKVMQLPMGSRLLIVAPLVRGRKGEFTKVLDDLRREGFSRMRIDGKVTTLDQDIKLDKKFKHDLDVVVDRIVLKEEATSRVAEAIERATALADGSVIVVELDREQQVLAEHAFSLALACPEHGHSLGELQPRDFSFNAPYGACPECTGLGFKRELDPRLLIPDDSLSINDGAIVALPMAKTNYLPQIFGAVAKHLGTTLDVPWCDYTDYQRECFMEGTGDQQIRVNYVTLDGRHTYWTIQFEGIKAIVRQRYEESSSDAVREKMERFFSTQPCEACHGARLKPEILAVTLGGKGIHEACRLSVKDALDFFEGLSFSQRDAQIADRIVREVLARLRFLRDVGLSYLTLDRATASLSGGEAQRIRLATQIGSGLMGVLYILDEPSIGLHQRDNSKLIDTLENLRDIGNTVIVVEHDEETIRRADHVIDLGPGAGEKGGWITAQGSPQQVAQTLGSITGDYLSGRRSIPVPVLRRDPKRGVISIQGARENNLKDLDIDFELGTFTVVTGVSGSGKSSLITSTLAPALSNAVHRSRLQVGDHRKLIGVEQIDKVIDIDQSPIGRTPRSNPATYIGLWDDLRQLFASLPESKARGYSPGRFSFNVSGGRCEACKGDGQIKIEMHFLPDVYVPCEVCHGSRYNRETLQVTYRGKNVSDVLDMTVDEALAFFENIPNVKRKLQTLADVGLGYIRLGQPATTLSGGEAQRVKLASELQRKQTGKTFYILDEPTTGLHMEDVRQ